MTLTRRDLDEVADELEASFDQETRAGYRPRYNVAPTNPHLVLRDVSGVRRVDFFRWGLLPTGRSRAPLINARAETAPFKDAFREAYVHHRCIVPADGFYEWRAGFAGKQPIWFHPADGRLLLMAGLWLPDGEGGRFTVLTTEPNSLVGQVHDRMPVLLSRDDAASWLARPSQALLRPAPDALLVATPVSSRVNAVKNDDPACLDPPDSRPEVQGVLFR